jgi:hypothetical protein
MLQDPTEKEDAAYCYQRAEEARRMARRASHPAERKKFQAMQRRWEGLARSCEFRGAVSHDVARLTGDLGQSA